MVIETSLDEPRAAATDFRRDVHCLLGVPLDAVRFDAAIARIGQAVAGREPFIFSTPNLNNLVAAQRDPAFRAALAGAELSVADGMPLVWMARMLGMPIAERVAGSDLFESLMEGAGGPVKVFFFGGPEGAAKAACERMNARSRPMRCVGWESPGFGNVEQLSRPDMLARINDSGADMLVLAMGTAKGNAWMARNRALLAPPVLTHLGAVVNFVAGSVPRAPSLARRSGLEWLWRIKEEPALWRRYWSDGLALLPLFVGRVLPQALGRLFGAGKGGGATPAAALAVQADGVRLTIAGVWTHAALAPLRGTLTAATQARADIDLDVSGLGGADAAFLGQMLLLYGHQAKTGRALRVAPVDARVRRLFARSCADYVLDGLAARQS